MTFYLKKCKLSTNAIDYLDHVIRPEHFEISTESTDTIPPSNTRRKGRKSDQFYRCTLRFGIIAELRRCCRPLNRKLCNCQLQTFEGLTHDLITTMDTLNVKLVEPPVLDFSGWQGSYPEDTDSCDKQIGCVALPKQLDRTGLIR